MEFELFDTKTGKTFKKTITPMSKAQSFINKCRFSKKIVILSQRYV